MKWTSVFTENIVYLLSIASMLLLCMQTQTTGGTGIMTPTATLHKHSMFSYNVEQGCQRCHQYPPIVPNMGIRTTTTCRM